MEIYSYSETPPKQPYYHMAYLATTTIRSNKPLMGIGIPLFLLGTILACKVVTSKGNWNKSIGIVFKKEGKWVKPGITLIVLGCIAIAAAYMFGERVLSHPYDMTYIYMRDFAWESYAEVISKDKPVTIEKLANVKIPRTLQLIDGWENKMEIRTEMKEDKQAFFIISAGKDGIFGNDDDITYNLSEFWAGRIEFAKSLEEENNNNNE